MPGLLTGTVDGEAIEAALDCTMWGGTESRVWAVGDDRYPDDRNGDGLGFGFSYVEMVDLAEGQITLDGRGLTLSGGFRPGPDAPKWVIDGDTARFEGPSAGVDSAEVDLTVDCAPRDLETQGYTGRLTGTLDGHALDVPLYCANWDADQSLAAQLPKDGEVTGDFYLMRATEQGAIQLEIGDRSYQIVIAPIMGTEAEVGSDTVSFKAELKNRLGEVYSADMTFDCTNR